MKLFIGISNISKVFKPYNYIYGLINEQNFDNSTKAVVKIAIK